MPLPSAVGSITFTKRRIAALLARCTSFQELVDADENGAASFIHINHKPAPANGVEYTLTELATLRPCAIIYTDELAPYQSFETGVSTWNEMGRTYIDIEAPYNWGLSTEEQAETIAEAIAQEKIEIIMETIASDARDGKLGLWQQFGEAEGLILTELSLVFGPIRITEELRVAQGDHTLTRFVIAWGQRG